MKQKLLFLFVAMTAWLGNSALAADHFTVPSMATYNVTSITSGSSYVMYNTSKKYYLGFTNDESKHAMAAETPATLTFTATGTTNEYYITVDGASFYGKPSSSGRAWSTYANGDVNSSYRKWQVTLSDGKYKLKNEANYTQSTNYYLGDSPDSGTNKIYADKTSNVHWYILTPDDNTLLPSRIAAANALNAAYTNLNLYPYYPGFETANSTLEGLYTTYVSESTTSTDFSALTTAIDAVYAGLETYIKAENYHAVTLGTWTAQVGEDDKTSEDGPAGSVKIWNSWQAQAYVRQNIYLPAGHYALRFIMRGNVSGNIYAYDPATNGNIAKVDFTLTQTSSGPGVENGSYEPAFQSTKDFSKGWQYKMLNFTLTEGKQVGIGIYCSSQTDKWINIIKEKTELLASDYTINENDNFAVPTVSSIDATLTRTLSASYWNTFSVPFDIATIPSGWTVKEFDSATDNVISFKDASSIVSGKPYLVKPTIDEENPTFTGVNITATEGSTDGTGNYQFAAQLFKQDLATDGTVAYLATDGNLKQLNTASGLKGLRAYFKIPASSEVKLFIDDIEMDIKSIDDLTIDNSRFESGEIYNLAGQTVNQKHISKGVYILNGKKILVK